MTDTYLSWPAVCAGTAHPIVELLSDPQRNMARDGEIWALVRDGFTDYRRFDGDPLEMAQAVMVAAAERANIDRKQVDAVLFATDSFWENEIDQSGGSYYHGWSRYRLLQTIRSAGFVNAQPYASWMSACGNLGAALSLARGLIASGQHQTILIVSFDKIPAGTSRLMGNGTSLFSDGAVGVIVSTRPQPLQLTALASRSSPRLSDPEIMYQAANPALAMMETVKAVFQVKSAFTAQSGTAPSDFKWLLMPNLRADVMAALAGLLGAKAERLRRDSFQNFAHMHANDNLLTLLAMEEGGEIEPGDEVVLFNAGTWAWHLASIRKLH